MNLSLPYDNLTLSLETPNNTAVYATSFLKPPKSSETTVLDALNHPHDSPSLALCLKNRRKGKVVIVVSDITRPIPYSKFLMAILSEIDSAGVDKDEIRILIATGMHRKSTSEERDYMFGAEINKQYRIIDHVAECEEDLITLPGKSWSGNKVRLNRHFVDAGFRMVTGLVEPHFMAGFSGGRKSVCPGLSSLETLQKFHGYEFLSHPLAKNGSLEGNPCHEEAVSMARLCGVDFTLNVVLNKKREVVKAFAGEIESSHIAACEFVKQYACPQVKKECDVVITSSGGYPLDATFYQCVKGLVSCLPTVKKGGTIISIGGCREGIGSSEYKEMMF
ncbi:nickel-dependent lactate racemase, partial [Candidatus Sumerlaeota bacterium]|nr:nickel-dependent lactate racemase [Candidatus Sumerlaeota bacterium]